MQKKNEQDETAYLLESPANAERLMESIAQVKAGKTKVRELFVPGGNDAAEGE